MNNLNNEIQSVINELNENIDTFIKNNEEELNKMEVKRNNVSLSFPLANAIRSNNKNGFAEYIRNGNDTLLKKALDADSGENGGYFLPVTVVEEIRDNMKFLSPMRSISKIVTISTNSVDVLVDGGNADAGWIGAENERIETDSPEIRKIKIPVHEIYAKPKANQHLLDDAQINVEKWLIRKVAEKIAALENDAFINGDGEDKPKGFLSYESRENEPDPDNETLQHFKTGADGNFGDNPVELLIDMACSLKPIYVRNAKWIMSRSAIAIIRKLKNQEGNFIWQPAIAESAPSTLLGYPVILDDDMPILREGTPSASVAFGDFEAGYEIVDRQGLEILRDPYSSKPFVEFYVSKRTGGAVVDFDAIKILKFEE